MSDLDTFEAWRKHQGYEGEELGWQRADFAAALARREAARALVFFSEPPPPGEYRYAVAVEDGDVLQIALVVVRRFKKSKGVWECFVMMPRDPDWDPHASYHASGDYHQKSFDQKMMPQKRQPLSQFKGTEHLGSFQGMSWAICDQANFTDVIKVQSDVLNSMRGSVLIDLVESGEASTISQRLIPGQTIVAEKRYADCSPSVVIAIVK